MSALLDSISSEIASKKRTKTILHVNNTI